MSLIMPVAVFLFGGIVGLLVGFVIVALLVRFTTIPPALLVNAALWLACPAFVLGGFAARVFIVR